MKFVLIFSLMILILSSIIGVGHLVVYRAILKFFSVEGGMVPLLRMSFIFLGLSFVASSIITSFGYHPLTRWLYYGSAVWTGTVFWLFLASVIAFLISWIGPSFFKPSLILLIGKALLLFAVILSVYGVWNGSQTQVTRYTVSLPELPPRWVGKTIVLVADTHLGNIHGVAFNERVVSLINREAPEAVLIAGDYYDGPPVDYNAYAKPFASLRASQGVFFATGNHEEFKDSAIYTNALTHAGVRILHDESVMLEGIQVIGVNYGSTTDAESLRTVLEKIGVNPDVPSILIKHVPRDLEVASLQGVDLQVSGHTHYGQIWPGTWITKMIYGAYAYGMHPLGEMMVITSSGAGTWGPPQRVGTKSEIVSITLESK